MAKKKDNETTNVQTTENNMKTTTQDPPVEVKSEMVVAPKTEMVLDENSMSYLVDKLPHLKAKLVKITRVNPAELEMAINNLDPVKQDNFRSALERLSAEKEGMHVASRGMQLPDMRLYQGTGDDQNRPETTPPGGIYGSDSVVLSVPPAHVPAWKSVGVGSELRVIVLNIMQTRTFWPPRNDPDFKIEGIEIKKNIPICSSLDRKRGSQFGDCSACAYRPFKDGQYNRDSCRDEMHFYFLTADLKHVYRMIIAGTSTKTGATPIVKKVSNFPKPWSFYFSLTTKVESADGKRWMTLVSNVAVDENNPQGVPVPVADQKLAALLCRQIDTEVYYPKLADIYTAESRKESTDADTDLAAAAAKVNVPDYSGNNNL